jgi:hypothetical protein
MKSGNIQREFALLTVVAIYLLIFNGCSPMPDPPTALEPGADDSAVAGYARAENGYAAAFYQKHKTLRDKLLQEISGREKSEESQVDAPTLSLSSTDGKSKIFIRNENELFLSKEGMATGGEELIYKESDPEFRLRLYLSASGRYIFIESLSHNASEILFLPADLKISKPKLISAREKGHLYTADHFDGLYLWILSNQKAPNRKLFVAPVVSPGQDSWNTAILHNDSVYISGFTIVDKQYLVLLQQKNMTTGLQVTEIFPSGKEKEKIENKIVFNDPLGRIYKVSYEPGEQKIVFLYSSLRTPPTCYTYGIKSRKLMIRWRRQVPGYNADNYNAEVLPLKRKDGSTIPVALIYRPDLSYTDGSNPLLIIAGSVRGQVTGDAFDPANISLLDRGFGIAVIDPARLMKTGSEYLEEDLAALIKLLTDKKQTNPGGIVVQAAQTNCAAVAGLMKKNPAMFRAVLFDDPIIPGPWEIQNHPPLFITNKWDNGSQNAINNLFSVSGLRRIKGDKNLLICETGFSDETVRNQSIASQWLFLLEECGIKK